jgi:hypothetical protein
VLVALAAAVDHAGFDGVRPVSLFLGLAGLGIAIWAFVELGCLRGTMGPNRFGSDLLAPVAVAESVTTSTGQSAATTVHPVRPLP